MTEATQEASEYGPEPSEAYLERLAFFENAVSNCIHVSKSYEGIRSPSGRHFYASVLFTMLCTKGVSLLSLAPHSPWAQKVIEHWDYGSAAILTRTLLEIRLAFFYLCADKVTDDEWNCRWNLFNLHDCMSRHRFIGKLTPGDPGLPDFEQQANELRTRLTDNSFFQPLPDKRQKALLKGKDAYLLPLEEIGERAGVATEMFQWLYQLMSSHVHAYPMSFYRMGTEERGRGLPSEVEEKYTCLCLSLASSLLVSARDEMEALFEPVIASQQSSPSGSR